MAAEAVAADHQETESAYQDHGGRAHGVVAEKIPGEDDLHPVSGCVGFERRQKLLDLGGFSVVRVEKLLLTSKILRADGFAFLPLFPHLFLDAPAAQKAGENKDGGENSQAYKQQFSVRQALSGFHKVCLLL